MAEALSVIDTQYIIAELETLIETATPVPKIYTYGFPLPFQEIAERIRSLLL